jgi:hypothetical protein
MNSEIMQHVEDRLNEWAEWFCHGNWYGLGYSPSTTIYRLMTEGIIVKGAISNMLPTNENAEEIEALIYEMWKQNEDLANAVRINYLTQGSVRHKSKKFSIHRNRLTFQLDLARQWLAGRLSAY